MFLFEIKSFVIDFFIKFRYINDLIYCLHNPHPVIQTSLYDQVQGEIIVSRCDIKDIQIIQIYKYNI